MVQVVIILNVVGLLKMRDCELPPKADSRSGALIHMLCPVEPAPFAMAVLEADHASGRNASVQVRGYVWFGHAVRCVTSIHFSKVRRVPVRVGVPSGT